MDIIKSFLMRWNSSVQSWQQVPPESCVEMFFLMLELLLFDWHPILNQTTPKILTSTVFHSPGQWNLKANACREYPFSLGMRLLVTDNDKDVLVGKQNGKLLLFSVPCHLTAYPLFLVGAFGGSYVWNDQPETQNRLLTCCFYKFSPGRSVLFAALVTGLLQSLKCKENKCFRPFISLKPCKQWGKYCGIALVNSNLFCGFSLCLQIRQYYLLKNSASGFHS